MARAPGTETSAVLAHTLVEHLMKLLVTKNIITDAECVSLLHQAINDIGQQNRANGVNAIDHIKNSMLTEHDLRD